jgi:hypothetical protein
MQPSPSKVRRASASIHVCMKYSVECALHLAPSSESEWWTTAVYYLTVIVTRANVFGNEI